MNNYKKITILRSKVSKTPKTLLPLAQTPQPSDRPGYISSKRAHEHLDKAMHDSERAGKGETKRKEKGTCFNQHTTNPHTTQTQLGNPTNIQINSIHIMTIPW